MTAQDTMRAKVQAYLTERRRTGFVLSIAGKQLFSFARFADRGGYRGPLTVDLASRWAVANRRGLARTAARRLEVLRPFARYCQLFDPDTVVPPRWLFGPGHRRLTPHIYTEREIGALLIAARRLAPVTGLRPHTCATVFGLLAATGLRISEACALRRDAVDLQHGVLHVRQAKFGKRRLVPLHPSATGALRRYAGRRDQDPASAATAAFFVFDQGRPVHPRLLQYAFRRLCEALRWRARGGHPAPRLHDVRHSFVCWRLRRWYDAKVDIDRHVLALSTYLGHAKVTDTYWYLTATPDLLARAARRLGPLAPRGGGR
jgi:integrase